MDQSLTCKLDHVDQGTIAEKAINAAHAADRFTAIPEPEKNSIID